MIYGILVAFAFTSLGVGGLVAAGSKNTHYGLAAGVALYSVLAALSFIVITLMS